jgi:NAD(P)-dependent dehydrogenase (short-subunit alcohol dehydrogenase family)
VTAAARSAGPVGLLVNNAAVSVAAAVEDTPADVAWAMFDTNVVGPLRLISAFLPIRRFAGRAFPNIAQRPRSKSRSTLPEDPPSAA